MPDLDPPLVIVPDHIDQTIQSVAQLRQEHHTRAPRLQRMMDGIIARMASPEFLVIASCIIAAWIAANLTVSAWGWVALDPPPFVGLASAMALVSFYVVLMIFAAQNREDQLAQHRELLIMELAIVSEQKIAKVIQLLEESRRDNPLIRNRDDSEAEAMALPADPHSVLGAIAEAQGQALA